MFELLYNSAKTNNTDISMCQVKEYDDINETYITSDYYSLEVLKSFENQVFSAEDTKNFILDINVALWNKIYKREYLNNIQEKFPEGFIYEDLPFFFGTYLPAKRIQIVWQNLYNYRINRKNSTMQQFNNKILDRLPMVSLTYEKLKNATYLNDCKKKIQGWIINDLFHRYTLLKENYHKEYFFLMKKVFQSLDIENIEDDFWKTIYHFQGYLLVIRNSFEEFNQKVFNEYLDIHEVENRLHSEFINLEDLDKRFNLVYSDMNKIYKYSEDLNNNTQNKIFEVDSKISPIYEEITKVNNHIEDVNLNINNTVDTKISTVYEEITKNYQYTNELNQNIKYDLDNKISPIYEEITKTNKYIEDVKFNINNSVDTKISTVYEEITKNYKYTETLISQLKNDMNLQLKETYQTLYNDIKDLSYVVQNNFEQQNILKNEIEEIINKIENITQETNKKIEKIIENNKIQLNSKLNEISYLITEKEEILQNQIEQLKQQQNIEKQNTENLKSEFISLLEKQQEKHSNEIKDLQEKLIQTENTLREEMKSPIKKLMEKYKKVK
jgi:predicted  nucleic acid-binding Zn-ribbon protein